MDLEAIRAHWQSWAKQYGAELRATTKASSAKFIELDALTRALSMVERSLGTRLRVLEAGCGNGQNCVSLAERHPEASFTGVDFVEEMIEAATALKKDRGLPDGRLRFAVGDVLRLTFPPASFEVVFTDRCLINLNTSELQMQAITSLAELVTPGGYLLMIENSRQTYDAQNALRAAAGLPQRTPAAFNHFFDDAVIVPHLCGLGLEVLDVEDFISFHDIVLYVLLPMVNGGKIDYDHPLVEAAAKLNVAASHLRPSGLGRFGQNRLYTCRRPAAS